MTLPLPQTGESRIISHVRVLHLIPLAKCLLSREVPYSRVLGVRTCLGRHDSCLPRGAHRGKHQPCGVVPLPALNSSLAPGDRNLKSKCVCIFRLLTAALAHLLAPATPLWDPQAILGFVAWLAELPQPAVPSHFLLCLAELFIHLGPRYTCFRLQEALTPA